MDKKHESELKRMREKCPTGQIRMIVVSQSAIQTAGALPANWPTDDEMLGDCNAELTEKTDPEGTHGQQELCRNDTENK